MMDLEKNIKKTEEILNKHSVDFFDKPPKSQKQEVFQLFLLQASIFNYEISSSLNQCAKLKIGSFSRKVVLKELIHKIFEYKTSFVSKHFNEIINLAEDRGLIELVPIMRQVYKSYKNVFACIDQYKDLRNKTTGHYDPNIRLQIELIRGIEEAKAFKVVSDFMFFNMKILKILHAIGMNTVKVELE